jgi:recombination protein RecT
MASATETLKEQVGIAKRPITILEKLESMQPQIAMALPKHLTPERMIRIAITCLRTNPKLAECEPQSILASVMLASQLGLEPGVLGQSFLVPYKKTCTLVPGWLGILDLVNRAGKATAWTGAVYKGDEFDWALGDKPFVTHRPCGDETQLTHVYAIARVKGSDYPIIEVWPMAKILKHRDRFNKVGDSHYSYNHFEMYARKVALLQAVKYVPRSIQLATAFELDASAEMGTQHLEIKDVPQIIEGSVMPEQAPEPEPVKTQEAKPKEEPVMCSECRKVGWHEADCKFAAKAESNGSKRAFTVSKVEKKKSTKKGEFLVLSVKTNEGSGLIYCWHKSLFPIFPTGESKPPIPLIAEMSEQKSDDGKVFHQIEHVLEFNGIAFTNDQPAEQGVVEADPGENLFGAEEP